jgi:tetrahydromethanopterin S-methyltransferase subunit H
MKTLYVKTGGPVPEYLTVGEVYKVHDVDEDGDYWILDKNNIERIISGKTMMSTCRAKWIFCDSTGNPVPAPWEEAEHDAIEAAFDAVYDQYNQPESIDYRAHAERLAEAAHKMLSQSDTPAQYDAAYDEMQTALAAYRELEDDL